MSRRNNTCICFAFLELQAALKYQALAEHLAALVERKPAAVRLQRAVLRALVRQVREDPDCAEGALKDLMSMVWVFYYGCFGGSRCAQILTASCVLSLVVYGYYYAV